MKRALARIFDTRLEWPAACSRNLQVAIARRAWAAKRKLHHVIRGKVCGYSVRNFRVRTVLRVAARAVEGF